MTKNGRHSETARLRAYKRFLAEQEEVKPYRETYRGFAIVRRADWCIEEGGKVWPVGCSSLAKARAAVDRCLALRAEVSL